MIVRKVKENSTYAKRQKGVRGGRGRGRGRGRVGEEGERRERVREERSKREKREELWFVVHSNVFFIVFVL